MTKKKPVVVVTRRLPELVDLGKKRLDKPLHTVIAVVELAKGADFSAREPLHDLGIGGERRCPKRNNSRTHHAQRGSVAAAHTGVDQCEAGSV